MSCSFLETIQLDIYRFTTDRWAYCQQVQLNNPLILLAIIQMYVHLNDTQQRHTYRCTIWNVSFSESLFCVYHLNLPVEKTDTKADYSLKLTEWICLAHCLLHTGAINTSLQDIILSYPLHTCFCICYIHIYRHIYIYTDRLRVQDMNIQDWLILKEKQGKNHCKDLDPDERFALLYNILSLITCYW